jgi:hypothetical protein
MIFHFSFAIASNSRHHLPPWFIKVDLSASHGGAQVPYLNSIEETPDSMANEK